MKNLFFPFLLGSLLLLTACDPQDTSNQASSLGNLRSNFLGNLGSNFLDSVGTNGTLLANDCGNGLIGLETTTGQILGFLATDLNGTPSSFILPENLTCEKPNALFTVNYDFTQNNNIVIGGIFTQNNNTGSYGVTVTTNPPSQTPLNVIATPEPRVIGGLVLLSIGGIVSIVSRSFILMRDKKSQNLKH